MKKTRRKSKKVNAIVFITVIVLIVAFIMIQNNLILTTEHTLLSNKIEGKLVIAHLSDLHGKVFAFGNNTLVRKTAALEPDIITITGDIVSMNTPNEKIEDYISLLIPRLVEIAPVYFVTGNHDVDNDTEFLFEQLEKYGAVVLDNKTVTFERFRLCGAGDANSYVDWANPYDDGREGLLNAVSQIEPSPVFTVLLSHRPEYVQIYREGATDLVLCGHAHGGQFRFPFIGGVFAPGQGFLPEYDAGAFELGVNTMIVSRGLGNSVFPFRLFNYPEIVAITIN